MARQALHVEPGKLFPDNDFWDRACALFLEELSQSLRQRHGNLQAGRLLEAILEASPPLWLETELFEVVAFECYQRVFSFAKTTAAAMSFQRINCSNR